jgi:hypothetical protein
MQAAKKQIIPTPAAITAMKPEARGSTIIFASLAR